MLYILYTKRRRTWTAIHNKVEGWCQKWLVVVVVIEYYNNKTQTCWRMLSPTSWWLWLLYHPHNQFWWVMWFYLQTNYSISIYIYVNVCVCVCVCVCQSTSHDIRAHKHTCRFIFIYMYMYCIVYNVQHWCVIIDAYW